MTKITGTYRMPAHVKMRGGVDIRFPSGTYVDLAAQIIRACLETTK